MHAPRDVVLILTLALAGVAPSPTPSATQFDAARTSLWDQFRHGHGLNDVVVNANIPGRVAWRFDAPQKGTSTSPVVVGTTVVIASNDHHLYAVDARDGRPVWVWKGDNEIMTAPVYRDGVAVIATGNADSPVWDPPIYNVVGMGANDLNGIDLQTGKTRWSFALTGTGMPMPAIVGRQVLHVDGSGVFLALDVRTGTYLWRRLFYSNASMTNILVQDGIAYFGGRFPNGIYALRAGDGAPVWSHGFPRREGAFDDCPLATDGDRIFGMYAVPQTRDPNVFVVTGIVARQHVYALDAKTGRLRWDTALAVSGSEPTYNESAIPLYADGTVYDGSPVAPIVTALDARSGHVKWSLHVSGPVKGGFVVRDGILYFGDLGGKLWAVDVADGRALGSVQTDLKFNVGSPIVVNDSLIDGSQQGPVIAIPLDDIRASRALDGVTNARRRDLTLVVVLGAVALLVLLGQYVRRRSRAPQG